MDTKKPISYASLLSKINTGQSFNNKKESVQPYKQNLPTKIKMDDNTHSNNNKRDSERSLFFGQKDELISQKIQPTTQKTQSGYDKKSLVYFIEELKQNITNLLTKTDFEEFYEHDRQLLKQCSQLFSQLIKPWNLLLDKLIKICAELDNLYKLENYLGIKEKIIHHLINISFSYIIIGPQTKTGKGISNIRGPMAESDYYNQVIFSHALDIKKIFRKPDIQTIDEKINSYIDNIFIIFQKINEINRRIFNIDRESNYLVSENNKITTSINNLDISIRKQKKQSSNNLNDEKIQHDKFISKQNETKNKIKMLSDEKRALENNSMVKKIELDNILSFNYCMNDLWCNSLSVVIPIQTEKTKINISSILS